MGDSGEERLVEHLRDAHAIEEQALKQLERAVELTNDDQIEQVYREHLEETQEHEKLVRERLEAHDHEPSAVKDLTMRSGAIGLRQLADIAPETPVKLAMHFYAFEHLEIANYELLGRIARGAGDDETAQAAEKILEQERAAAEKVAETFDRAAELLLEAEESEGEEGSDSGSEEASREKEEAKS
ncbi:MAG: DUF892 family protein [Solirubrobacterales bacterium]|nr:DUF892 family protein [Solirubrobacterales bacterium]MBV9474172.1 DUF892 family protein [Solirubrobacterales bacterium]